MNERIQRLSDQADAFARETVAYYRNEHDEYPHKLYEVSREKFAELIVLECAKVLWDSNDILGEYRIRKHFGVEE